MTWKEFKERCEAVGIKDTDEIKYIDTTGQTDAKDIFVERFIGDDGRGVVAIS